MIGALPQVERTDWAACSIQELTALAVDGLQPMFDAGRKLFCLRVRQSEHGLVREGISHRYTIIALLGLQQWERSGNRSPIDVGAALDALVTDTNWIANLGDLGLLLWLCTLASPHHLEKLLAGVNVQGAWNRSREAREGHTMELAWFLSGLSHVALARRDKVGDCADLAAKTFRLLKSNQGKMGTFGHLAREAGLAGRLRGRIGSFADQVYPIYALAQFAKAFDNSDALQMASACAEAICRVQGPLGQWWWHYDSATGKVAGKYPVYSVHQDGMAPMALFALEEVKGSDFRPSIYRGLEWITGKNELKADLREPSTSMIWRSIYCSAFDKYLGAILNRFGSDGLSRSQNSLRVRFESRPYHFGWLLYAFADRRPGATSARQHLVGLT